MVMHTLAAELGISHSEANFRLFVAAGGTMTPAAVTDAVNQIRRLMAFSTSAARDM